MLTVHGYLIIGNRKKRCMQRGYKRPLTRSTMADQQPSPAPLPSESPRKRARKSGQQIEVLMIETSKQIMGAGHRTLKLEWTGKRLSHGNYHVQVIPSKWMFMCGDSDCERAISWFFMSGCYKEPDEEWEPPSVEDLRIVEGVKDARFYEESTDIEGVTRSTSMLRFTVVCALR